MRVLVPGFFYGRIAAFVLTTLLFFSSSAHAELKALLGDQLFDAAGLEKLTDAERKALEDWLRKRGIRASESAPVVDAKAVPSQPPVSRVEPVAAPKEPRTNPQRADDFGSEQLKKPVAKEAPEAITARIKGEFKGWSGKTIFRLDNGQVWQQRVGGNYRSARRTDPEVVVERGRFGYYLRLVETGRSVGVKRIR